MKSFSYPRHTSRITDGAVLGLLLLVSLGPVVVSFVEGGRMVNTMNHPAATIAVQAGPLHPIASAIAFPASESRS